MELAVRIEPIGANGFRATSGEPMPASAEGPTKPQALSRLREVIRERLQAGTEVVHIEIDVPHMPIWPPGEFTDLWLAGIAEARERADQRTLAGEESP